MLDKLPKFALTEHSPAFYDRDSVTTIEMCSKIYGKLNEVVDEVNSFVENVNKIVEDFKSSTTKDLEEFEVALRQEFQDFIDVVNLHITKQDQDIQEAVSYMRDNLETSVTTQINNAILNGRIVINAVYDDETENLNIAVTTNNESI